MKYLVLVAFLFSYVSAQQEATTKDGMAVTLKPDGTWEYTAQDTVTPVETLTFRKTSWGMSRKQVKASEELQPGREEENIVGYSSTVAGLNVFIFYVFVEDKLVRAQYYFKPQHTNKNDFLED